MGENDTLALHQFQKGAGLEEEIKGEWILGCGKHEVGEETLSWTGKICPEFAGRRKFKAYMASFCWAWVLEILLEEWESFLHRGS